MAEAQTKTIKRPRANELRSPARSHDKERLLEAAERLAVTTKLGKSFTTNALAKEGVMSVGSIHKVLGSREAIISLLLRRQAGRLSNRLAPVTSFDRLQVLRGHQEAVFAVVSANPDLFAVLDAIEGREFRPKLRGLRFELQQSLAAAFSQPGVPQWAAPGSIAGHLAGIMVTLAIEAVRHGLPLHAALRNIDAAGLSLLDRGQLK